jgi:hypothetical protein
VTGDYERISIHGVRRDLLVPQGHATGLPLIEVEIPAGCSNDVYEQRIGQGCSPSSSSQPAFRPYWCASTRPASTPRSPGERLIANCSMTSRGEVDPCGENGEFHTFVHSGPIFSRPISCTPGEAVQRDGFVFCDVLPH